MEINLTKDNLPSALKKMQSIVKDVQQIDTI
jgi:hypothetical protein